MKMKNILLTIPLLSVALSTMASTDPLFKDQWGVINNGQVIHASSGEFTRDELVGRSNIDINWTGLEIGKDIQDEIIVAVIDSGVDINHPELQGRIWENKACKGKTEEERKYLACNGRNVLDGNNDLTDDIGHGTHVSGIIASNKDGKGITGITPSQVKIMPIKAINSKVNGFVYKKRLITDIFAEAIEFAVNNGADVINMSLGWPNLVHGEKIKKAIQYAISKNVPIVAASGNNNKLLPVYPCAEPGVICVGAVDNQGSIVEFSNYGGKVDILAPGYSILGLYPLKKESRVLRIKGYESKNGSSQAAPFVSGIIASMKLLNKGISVDQIKARLYATARELPQNTEKYSKFGLVDMKKAISTEISNFFIPDYKSLQVVEVFNNRFYFKLPIKNMGEDQEKVNVTISLRDGEQEVYKLEDSILNFRAGKSKNITLSGEFENAMVSADLELVVSLKSENFSHQSKFQLAFARNLIKDNALEAKGSIQNPNNFFALITPSKRSLYIRPVEGIEKDHEKDEYYIHAQNNVLILNGLTGALKKLELTDIYKVIGLFQLDVNLDGNRDYFVYSISADKKNIFFDYYKNDGSPLFGERSRFIFPITEFEGLPIKDGKEEFQYLVVNNPTLGKIRVPILKKQWTLPEADNTDDFFDALPNTVKVRPYYLNPVVSGNTVNVEIRTLESFNFLSAIKNQLGANFDTEVELNDLYDQTALDYKNKEVKALLAFGNEFLKDFYVVTFKSPTEYTLNRIENNSSYLESNKTVKLEGKRDIYAHTTLLKKNQIRVAFERNYVTTDVKWSTMSWSDPVFDILGGYSFGDTQHLFVETRYWLNHLEIKNGKISESRLPLNRDSSFPGVGFSETMKPFSGEIEGSNRVGVLVDSSLLYGNRVYAMVSSDNGLTRPLALSFRTPKNCINLGIKNHGGTTTNGFVCLGQDKRLHFSYFKLAN